MKRNEKSSKSKIRSVLTSKNQSRDFDRKVILGQNTMVSFRDGEVRFF